MTKKEKLQELLQELIHAIYSIIKDGLEKGTLQPQVGPYFRWKLTEFEYGDTGIIKKSAKGEEVLRPYWGRATRAVFKRVSELGAHHEVITAITKDYGVEEDQCTHYLETITTKVAGDILAGKIKAPTDSAKYITSLLKDLNGESQEYRAEVKLKGLVLQPRSIQLDDNVRLRKPNRSDFEREVPVIFPSRGIMALEDPTAFLHTRVYTEADAKVDSGFQASVTLQNEIYREIAVLRLFRVGAVQYIQYTEDSDSIIHPGVSTLTSGRLRGSDKYLITREDVNLLKAFWANMKSVTLPSSASIGEHREPDELSIAYDRYGDSLEANVLEKRISSAVMGLEALYLGGGEQQEMSYRLRMRVGKLLGLIGYNPGEVQEKMKDAYNEIRSKYVHGGLLKQKDKQRLEKRYGDINEFSKTVMDYLRASIVALLLRKISKTSLIQKIDDSFLDTSKDGEIRKLLFMPYDKEAT